MYVMFHVSHCTIYCFMYRVQSLYHMKMKRNLYLRDGRPDRSVSHHLPYVYSGTTLLETRDTAWISRLLENVKYVYFPTLRMCC